MQGSKGLSLTSALADILFGWPARSQEIVKPDVFWYDAPTKIDLPFNIVGLVLFELVTMHWVETKVRLALPCTSPTSCQPGNSALLPFAIPVRLVVLFRCPAYSAVHLLSMESNSANVSRRRDFT